MPKPLAASDRADVYSRITAAIIAAIEAGAGACRMPWHHDGAAVACPANVASARRYRGINVLALWAAAQAAGYPDGLWGTYRQWREAGGQVRGGERAITVVLWKEVRPGDAEDGTDEGRRRMFARAFAVFNLAQVEGYAPPARGVLPESERLAHAEAFIGHLGIPTVWGGSEAYYRPATDTVQLPAFERFRDTASAYAVWLHECGHATGARHRLDRDLSGRLGIAHHPRPDHAGYIASWLDLLRDDPRAIFTAAGKAQQAADWMHARQPRPSDAEAADLPRCVEG